MLGIAVCGLEVPYLGLGMALFRHALLAKTLSEPWSGGCTLRSHGLVAVRGAAYLRACPWRLMHTQTGG